MNVEEDKKRIGREVDLLSTMLESLVELLEQKGVLTQKECEKRIKEKAIV